MAGTAAACVEDNNVAGRTGEQSFTSEVAASAVVTGNTVVLGNLAVWDVNLVVDGVPVPAGVWEMDLAAGVIVATP